MPGNRPSPALDDSHVRLVVALARCRGQIVQPFEAAQLSARCRRDVVTELVFPDPDAYLAWIEKLGVDAVAADEHRFLEGSRTRAYVIDERSSLPGSRG